MKTLSRNKPKYLTLHCFLYHRLGLVKEGCKSEIAEHQLHNSLHVLDSVR